MPSSQTHPLAVLSVFLFLLAPYECARPLGVIRAVHSTSDHHLITNHRKLKTVSPNSFPRRAPLPPSGHSKRRNTELSPIDRVQLPGVIGAVRSTNHHHLIPDHRKLETVSPNSFPRRAPLPPSGHSKRRNTELNPSDRGQLPGVIGAVRSTDHHRIISDSRNLKMGQMFNFLPRRVPLPPSAPSKRRNAELQSDPPRLK